MKNSINKRTISFSPPDISEEEISEVVKTLRSGWITTGPRTKLLERRLAAYIDTGRTDIDCDREENAVKYGNRVVCLNSATAAEELNLRLFGIRSGDEVLVPAYTYTATASAACHCGAIVKFVDIYKDGDPVTHMPEMDYEKLEAAITPRTKAIIAVDIGGIVCDYEKILEIAERKRAIFTPLEAGDSMLDLLSSRIQKTIGRVAVFADCAHSLGASRMFKGEKKYCGAMADFSSFSFHAVKNLTTAEGGAATWLPIEGIADSEIYKTSSIGLRQLDRYLELVNRRAAIISRYDTACDELGISRLVHHTDNMDSSNHLYLIRIPGFDEEQRGEVIGKMAERGVATNVHYKPLPMMTAYGKDWSGCPNAYDYYHNLITLPLHTLLTDDDVEYVCESLKVAVEEVREHRCTKKSAKD